jgi:hypothetical protein
MDFSFCPTLAEILATREARGETKIFTELASLSTPNNLLVLRNFTLRHKPVDTLEVGLAFGASALTIATSGSRHVACDPYQQRDWDNAGLAALKRAGLPIEFYDKPSALVLPNLLDQGRRFGLIYIDGSHFFDDVFVDLYFAIRLLTDDGVVMLDDSTTSHIGKVLSFVRGNWAEWVAEVDLTPYRTRSLKYEIARRLHRVQLTAFQRTGVDGRPWSAPLRSF